tara:strand:+ start:74 stop:304 length:231 start_codon:yes stop_codon:yes gene_type:complete
MSKPISNAKFRKLIKAMPAEKQRESLERSLRVLPQFILEEAGRVDGHYNPKVVKFLESRLRTARNLWSEYLIENHA